MTLRCTSRIDRVVVHARGAVVSRIVDVGEELPDGVVDLIVPGITVLAETGTFRASAAGRGVVSVKSSLEIPATGSVSGVSVERVNALAARIDRLQSHVKVLRARRERLNGLTLDAALSIRVHAGRGKERVGESLAATELIKRWQADLDERLADLDEQLADLTRERDAAVLADRQARSAERMGEGHPTRAAHVRLEGRGRVREVRLEYVVMPARWWPIYTLRIEGKPDKTSWLVEGLVAQLSGEDWTGVHLSLSTADLIFDARLPELPSLRLGRAQRARSAGYRPGPPDLDRMFAAFDAGYPSSASASGAGFAAPAAGAGFSMIVDVADSGARSEKHEGRRSAPAPRGGGTAVAGGAPGMASAQRMAPPPPPPPAAAPMQVPMPPPPMSPMPMAKARLAESGSLGAVSASEVDEDLAMAGPPPAPPEPEIEPADAWLDFDSLTMAPPSDRSLRGRLRRGADDPGVSQRAAAVRQIGSLQPGPKVKDPSVTRGLFDARYEAEGLAEVPSDARAHRICVARADAPSELRYRTVPREAAEVYRELSVKNPFGFPVLDGPADVYLDGSLAAATELGRLDLGGVARVGLGVEERIRVVRNVRVDEETTGLLGGGTAVHHSLAIEVSSSLAGPAVVEVADRIPDTDDKDIEVKLVSSRPTASRYSQAERGAPIRGGLAWVIEVPPGGKQSIEYRYRIGFSSKTELVGGNRRD